MVFKRRYTDRQHPGFARVSSWRYFMARFHHAQALVAAHADERARLGGRILHTERYRAWIAKRDLA